MKTPEEIFLLVEEEKENLKRCVGCNSVSHCKEMENYKRHELNAMILLYVKTPVELSKLLKTPFLRVKALINDPVYEYFTIPKKKGGSREIYAPEIKLKNVQKRLNYFLQGYYLTIKPKEVHGFVINPRYLGPWCNIAENARVHTGKKFVLNVDLKDFFPSISAKQVKDLFSSDVFKFNEQIATAMALLTTYEGKLPIGAPTSPVISNFICRQLDADLIEFSEANSLSYTRYADDLTFSSNNEITIESLLEINKLVQKNNFKTNEKKLRLTTSHRKQTVTGLTVNEKVNVDRKLLKKTRAMLHDLTTNGVNLATWHHFNFKGGSGDKLSTKFISRLGGYINFIGQARGTNDSIYIKMKEEFKNAVFVSEC